MLSTFKRGCCTLLLLLLILTTFGGTSAFADTPAGTAGSTTGNTASAVVTEDARGTSSDPGQATGNGQAAEDSGSDDSTADEDDTITDDGAAILNAADQAVIDIEPGKTVKIRPASGRDPQKIYLTFRAVKDGLLTVTGQNFQGTVQLQKENGKAISDSIAYDTQDEDFETANFGVSKGTTYRLCFNGALAEPTKEQAAQTTTGQTTQSTFKSYYSVRLSNTAVSSVAGSRRAKAQVMKRGKSYQGVITAGKKETDWYRINLNKPQRFRLNYEAKTCGSLKIYFYGTGIRNHVSTFRRTDEGLVGRVWTGSKVSAGTYYVKVVRSGNNSSGVYTLTWI